MGLAPDGAGRYAQYRDRERGALQEVLGRTDSASAGQVVLGDAVADLEIEVLPAEPEKQGKNEHDDALQAPGEPEGCG